MAQAIVNMCTCLYLFNDDWWMTDETETLEY